MNKELIDKLKEFLNSGDKLLNKYCYKNRKFNKKFCKKFNLRYSYLEQSFFKYFELMYVNQKMITIIYEKSQRKGTWFEFEWHSFYERPWTIREFINKGLGVE